jgi:hypothetical protein
MTAPKMTRVTVRVPRTTLDQINDWVDTLGVRRSHFLGIALVAGVRSLIRASALEIALASAGAVETATRPPGQAREALVPVSTDIEALSGAVETLQTEVIRLQTEIAELRAQLNPQPSGRKAQERSHS